MYKQVLINVEETDIRVAMLEDGTLVELFLENFQSLSRVGNIYKGKVEGIVPGLKAVFVNIGAEKNAFLHFDDVLPEYELPMRGRPERQRRSPVAATGEEIEEELNGSGAEGEEEFIEPLSADGEAAAEAKAPVKKVRQPLRVGDEIMVQVTKDMISTKGPRITSYVSLPGRYLVLMPHAERGGGVSRRIEDAEERQRLRQILKDIKPGHGQGSFIIRTAGLDQDQDAIEQDARQLQLNWQAVVKRASRCRAPACVLNEDDILRRVVRDNFSDDLSEILIDSKRSMRDLLAACDEMAPNLRDRIHFYDSPTNIFDTFEVENQFQKALRHKVWMRSGGVIVIDETEALTAIDVNSGKYVGQDDQDQVILKTNLEACRAIARQLRLRDLGGLIVIDFIDMASRDHENQVMREFRRCLRSDRAKYSISGFSEFGLVEMTRKRVRKSLAKSYYRPCPYCEGTSRIISEAQLWKQLKYDLIAKLESDPQATSVDIVVHSQLKTYIQENVADTLRSLAGRYSVQIHIIARIDFHHERIEIVTHVDSTADKTEDAPPAPKARRRKAPEKKLESAPAAHNNAS